MSDYDGFDIEEDEVPLVDELLDDEFTDSPHEQEDEDWGDSYDDMDSEGWNNMYGNMDEEITDDDPWDLS